MEANYNEEENTLEISWNPEDPLECVFNTWTEDDFLKCFLDAANKVLETKQND